MYRQIVDITFVFQNILLLLGIRHIYGVIAKPDLRLLRERWEECCRTSGNTCIDGSCYSVEWREAAWSAVRDRCRGKYVDWPFAVDIFRVEDEEDITMLWRMFAKAKAYNRNDESELPATVWTSGTSCPERNATGMVVRNRWTSNAKFPRWLEAKLKDTKSMQSKDGRNCKFLVIYPSNRSSAVSYELQDQEQKHAAVCQFLFQDDDTSNTPSDNYSETETESTSLDISTSSTGSTEYITSSFPTISSAAESWSDVISTVTNTEKSKTKSSATIFPTTQDSTSSRSSISEGLFSGCKGRYAADIMWPDAPFGTTVNVSCPKGMRGNASWTCDAKLKRFRPDYPKVDQCRHVWIDDIETKISLGKDAVEISENISNKAHLSKMSHGDLPALVQAMDSLLTLFAKQTEDSLGISTPDTDPVSPPSFNFTKHVAATYSYVLREDTKRAWSDLDKEQRGRGASKVLEQMTIAAGHLSCASTLNEGDLQFTVMEENINLQTFVINQTDDHDVKRKYIFPEREPGIYNGSSLIFPGSLPFDQWPSSCGNKRAAYGIIYRRIGEFLQDKQLQKSNTVVVSPVISFTASKAMVSIQLPPREFVAIELERTIALTSADYRLPIRCVFWNFSRGLYGEWDNTGCYEVYSNKTHTKCACNHLTNFAVIMDINGTVDTGDPLLRLLTLVCCGISSIALLLTVICLLGVRSLRCRRSTITCNLSFCLLAMNILIVFGLKQTETKMVCAVVAGLIHFSVLSAFFWMLLEGFHLYQVVVLVFSHSSYLPFGYYYGVGYGLPLIIVGSSAAIQYEDYGGSEVCWLSNKNGLMWSFVGPACVVILINLLVFILTLKSASSAKIKKEQSVTESARAWAKGSLSILCLLGLTWCIGLLYAAKMFYAFSYVFTVLNGLQGVFIFIFHVLLNEKATSMFLKIFCKKIKCRRMQQRNYQQQPVIQPNSILSNHKETPPAALLGRTVSANTICSQVSHISSNTSSEQKATRRRQSSSANQYAIIKRLSAMKSRLHSKRTIARSISDQMNNAQGSNYQQNDQNYSDIVNTYKVIQSQ